MEIATCFFKQEASSQNQQLRPINTSFLQRPMIRNLAPAPSSHFPLPCRIVQSEPQRSSFPHPYHFPSQPVDGRQHMNEEWRMPPNGCSADPQYGAWIGVRNPFPGSRTVTDGMHMRETSQTFVSFSHLQKDHLRGQWGISLLLITYKVALRFQVILLRRCFCLDQMYLPRLSTGHPEVKFEIENLHSLPWRTFWRYIHIQRHQKFKTLQTIVRILLYIVIVPDECITGSCSSQYMP